ncbi:hypothetical protein DM860_017236 [Cuscuta australis]|uniref:22alpha-hydroxysteroid 23-monooxygenase n=2 Tax=Cuscuta sect. Cleistogrammica TaxID=1824901 RepID=A0A328E3E3_9ASTE|nr:hypothetical protein DM860_017236 [Cuscuta australis]
MEETTPWDWAAVIGAAVAGVWVVVVAVQRRRRRRTEEDDGMVPRGSSGWPLIGETLEFIASGYSSRPVSFMDKRKSLHGKVFKTHLLGKPVIVSTDPEVNRAILLNPANAFVPSYPKSVTDLFGANSILQMTGSLHKRLHAAVGGYLKSPPNKARFAAEVERTVRRSLSSWAEEHRNFVYVQDHAKQIAFEVLVKVLMSVEPGEDLDFMRAQFEEFMKGLVCIPINLPGTTLYKSLKAKGKLLKLVEKMVEERKVMVGLEEKGSAPPTDAIDLLLRDAAGEESDGTDRRLLPPEFIPSNLIEMMIPGVETMPTAMTLVVKFLSDNPLALAQLREENMELRRRKLNSGEEYVWTDYMSLYFTQNVISETLRMANIINAVWRKANKDVQIKGHLIPEGWCVLASLISVHMDEENYENPYDFNPWRWENPGMNINSSKFTPFGGGQRLCPGLELSRLEISIFVHHLVTTYRWVAEEDEIVYFPTVKMKRKLPISVAPVDNHL